MRRILLALIALACAVPTAEAAQRNETRQTASRQQVAAPAPVRERATPVRQSNLRPGDVRTQREGVVVRGAAAATVPRNAVAPRSTAVRRDVAAPRNAMANNCTRRNGRTVCAPARSSIAGWQRGLPTANYAQRECPEGTLATLARGHDDVVRCMPL